MGRVLKSTWLAVITAAGSLLAFPAGAQATLTYVKGVAHPAVYVARDDGSGAHRLGRGSNPRVSPDGRWVVFLHEGPGHRQEMVAQAAAGGAPRTLMRGWRETSQFAFAPDSSTIAALRGPEIGKRTLVVVDLAAGTQRRVATGYFSGFGFSPDGTELVYARAKKEAFPLGSDLFRAPVAGGAAVRLTRDHRSQNPLWGPDGTIVFVKQMDAKKRRYGPKNDLFLMDSEGRHVRRLTHTKVGPLVLGLFPTEWSGDGTRLLCEFEGQDTTYAVAVDPSTGSERVLGGSTEQGFVGTAISRDGSTVLGAAGGFEPGLHHYVATIPFTGGRPTMLVDNAYEPDWSR